MFPRRVKSNRCQFTSRTDRGPWSFRFNCPGNLFQVRFRKPPLIQTPPVPAQRRIPRTTPPGCCCPSQCRRRLARRPGQHTFGAGGGAGAAWTTGARPRPTRPRVHRPPTTAATNVFGRFDEKPRPQPHLRLVSGRVDGGLDQCTGPARPAHRLPRNVDGAPVFPAGRISNSPAGSGSAASFMNVSFAATFDDPRRPPAGG